MGAPRLNDNIGAAIGEIYDNKESECKKIDDVVSLLPSMRQIDFVAKPLRKRSNRLQASFRIGSRYRVKRGEHCRYYSFQINRYFSWSVIFPMTETTIHRNQLRRIS